MQISELIATLHHEVSKSYAFIAESTGGAKPEASVLHLNIERLEIELPVIMSQQEIEYRPASLKGHPLAFKKLSLPFTPLRDHIPKKPIKGSVVSADIVGPLERADERVSPESIGRIKIIFKLVIS